jgi:hypothetical protein
VEIIPQGDRDDFRLLRNVVEHEDNLLNYRFSWLIVAQSFLLAACVSSKYYPFPAVVAGLASTVLTYVSLVAAVSALHRLRIQVGPRFDEFYPHLMSRSLLHFLGILGPITVPPVFLVVWLWALLCAPHSPPSP